MFYDFVLPLTVIGPDWSVIGPDWSVASLVLLFHPIRFKSEIIRDLVTYVSPRFLQFVCFYFQFSLAHYVISFLPIVCRYYLVLDLRCSIEMCSKIA